jgi:exopolysaccharide production protein ExoZ
MIKILQILRAVAAICVVYVHTGNSLFGQFGVDIFFVLSGFVIAMVARTNVSAVQFFVDRITRVAPLYWILTTCVVVIAIVQPNLLHSTTFKIGYYFQSLLFLPHFETSGLRPLLEVGWTLNFEMLFYVVSTFVLLVARSNFLKINIFFIVSMYAACAYLESGNAFVAQVKNPIILEFAFGLIVYRFRDLLKNIPISANVGIILVCFIYMMQFGKGPDGDGNISFRFINFGIPSALILLSCLALEDAIGNGRAVKSLCFIGDSSYAIYLSHLFVIALSYKFLSIADLEAIRDSVWVAFFNVAASIFVGAVIYILVDKPSVSLARRIWSSIKFMFPLYRHKAQIDGK